MSKSAICDELIDYFNEFGTAQYEQFLKYFVRPVTVEQRHAKWNESICSECKTRQKPLRACLSCVFIGCCSHSMAHLKALTHCITGDLSTGHLYCLRCRDFVYHPQYDHLLFNAKCHRQPSATGLQRTKAIQLRSDSFIGLRGLVNLGNTCFMSVVIQAITHAPILRNWFLADRHQCRRRRDGCLMCEIVALFQDFYSSKASPIMPYQLLYGVWKNAKHLAGYEQQDAHEFFMALLDMLHKSESRTNNTQQYTAINGAPSLDNYENCDCIIDKVFTGALRSDVTCQACQKVSTTIDPFWDISLDLTNTPMSPHPYPTDKNNADGISLISCLRRFTRAENLGMGVICSRCNSSQDATKQFTMHRLPTVISFHLKRFEHCSAQHKKMTQFVSYPLELDMSPFLTNQRNGVSKEQRVGDRTTRQSSAAAAARTENVYILFAVILHNGSIEGGHYTAYIRHHSADKDCWYKCDDHMVTIATVEEMLSQQAYLLFYHRRQIEYK